MTQDEFIRLVKQRMRKEGLTTYQLAQRLKGRVSQATIYNFVNDGKPIKLDTFMALIEALGMEFKITLIYEDDYHGRKH